MQAKFSTNLRRILIQVYKSIIRDKWTNLMTVLALMIIFLMVNIASAFTFLADSVISNLEKKVDVPVFLNWEVSNLQTREFLFELKNKQTNGEIQYYNYVSREDALKAFEKEHPGRMVFLHRYGIENPLSPMVSILPARGKTQDLLNFLQDDKYANIIDQNALKRNVLGKRQVENFIALANFTKTANIAVLALFLVAALSLVFHAINTSLRKHFEEIFVMRLVGAKFSHIRTPYLIEGMIIAILGFILGLVLAIGCFYLFLYNVADFFIDSSLAKAFVEHANRMIKIFNIVAPFMGILVILLSFFSSYFAVEQHLRK